jgi:predicted nucleic acid-binding protein
MRDDVPLLDTNILVYAYDTSEKDKRSVCREFVRGCLEGEEKYAVSIQNLSEFYVVVTGKIENPLPPEVAEKRIEGMIEYTGWVKIKPDVDTISHATKVSRKYRIHYWDALLAATMKESGISKIYRGCCPTP